MQRFDKSLEIKDKQWMIVEYNNTTKNMCHLEQISSSDRHQK